MEHTLLVRLGQLALSVSFLGGCAYVGEPLPPALKIPERIMDLRAVQRGDKILMDFTPPKLTTEGLVIEKLGAPDLRIGDTPVAKESPAAPWVTQTIEVRVRYANLRGRVSDWSNVVRLTVVPPLAPPNRLLTEMTPGGAKVSWSSPASKFRVFRDGTLVGTTAAPPYLDADAELGQTYSYTVQAVQAGGDAEAESEISQPAALAAIDRFAPEAPKRLTVIAGINSVELSWERSAEPDLASYRVYRDGKLVADKLTSPNYSDRQVQSGVRYRYAVTAVDKAGNESGQTAAEIVFP